MPAVRDLTRDGRWSTYEASVLNLSNVSFLGKCARIGNTAKIPSPTKLARLSHFPPASQAGRLAGPVFYSMYTVCIFSDINNIGFDILKRSTTVPGTEAEGCGVLTQHGVLPVLPSWRREEGERYFVL
jgi:hypothetical protein